MSRSGRLFVPITAITLIDKFVQIKFANLTMIDIDWKIRQLCFKTQRNVKQLTAESVANFIIDDFILSMTFDALVTIVDQC